MIRFVVVHLRELISDYSDLGRAGNSFPGSYERKSSLISTFFSCFLLDVPCAPKLYPTRSTTAISFCCSRVCFVSPRPLRHEIAREIYSFMAVSMDGPHEEDAYGCCAVSVGR